jgi:hypothetical protein
MHGRARQQGRVHLERRVLGGRPDEAEQPGFDVRQEGILLRLVEAVHLVDEEHRAAARTAQCLRLLDGFADVLHARQHGRQHDEVGPRGTGQQPRQRGLAHARRAPQDDRRQPAGLEGHAQRPPGRQQVALAHHLVQRARAQAFGQRHAADRRVRFFGKQRVLRRHGRHCGSAGSRSRRRHGGGKGGLPGRFFRQRPSARRRRLAVEALPNHGRACCRSMP